MSDQFWLDGKVLRKGKEYVGEFAAYEPLLLRELLTDKQAQKAQPPCGADGAVPETDAVCAAMDRQYLAGLQAGWGLGSLNDRDGYTAAQNARRNDLALLASQPAAPVAPAPVAVPDEVDLWCFLRDVLKRGASIESQFSQQGYETFISEIEAAARKEDGRLRAMLAASTTEERDPYASHSHDEAIAAAHADGKIKFTPPGPITGVWIDEATEPSKEGE